MSEEFEGKKCDECHQNKQETVDLDLPDGTHTVVCRECVEAIVEQFQAEEAIIPQPEQEPSVKLPESEDEAVLMNLLSDNWLRNHAPHRLNQPEHIPDIRNMAEPVAWMSKENGDVNKSRSYFKFPEEHQHETIVPLYEHEGLTPRQGLAEYKRGYARAELDLKREPLSDKDIGKGFLLTDVWHRYECFIAGVKFAEDMPGIIGGGDE